MFNVPIYLKVGKKNISLNLNQYRNWHYRSESKYKKMFCELMWEILTGKKFNKPNITYTIYYARGGKHDKMNVGSIISKYLLDSMVYYGCIIDDSDEYVWEERVLYGWIDKENPRCEIDIS